jgi:tRNA nucleotidyltransferase (CCA-adding enzyme)
MCERLRVPNDYRDLGVLVAEYHAHCHRVAELRAATLLDCLQALDAFRRPERVEQFCLACEADSRGREGYAGRDYPQGRQFRAAFEAARAVDTVAVAGGESGPQVGERIRKARIEAIQLVQAAQRAASAPNVTPDASTGGVVS